MDSCKTKSDKRTESPAADEAATPQLELVESVGYGFPPDILDYLGPPLTEADESANAEKWAKEFDTDYQAACTWYRTKNPETTSPEYAFDEWANTMKRADRELSAFRLGDLSRLYDDDAQSRLESVRPSGSRAVILDIIAAYVGRLFDWHFADAPLTFTGAGPAAFPRLSDTPIRPVPDDRRGGKRQSTDRRKSHGPSSATRTLPKEPRTPI